jgi:hypothetical protein
MYQDAAGRHPGYVVSDPHRSRRRLVFVAGLLTLAGCATVEPQPGPRLTLGFAVTAMDQRLPGRLRSRAAASSSTTTSRCGSAASRTCCVAWWRWPYTRPAPLSADPVDGLCYRQTGSLSFDRLPGTGGLGPASAVVTFDDGRRVALSGATGSDAPPPCRPVFVP